MRATWGIGNGRCSGFTLLELLVVLMILVLIAGAFPFAINRALPSRRLKVAAQGVSAALRQAQLDAAEEGRIIHKDRKALVALVPARLRLTLTDADGAELSEVALFPDGSTSDARLTVSDATHSDVVVLSGLTGRIRMLPIAGGP